MRFSEILTLLSVYENQEQQCSDDSSDELDDKSLVQVKEKTDTIDLNAVCSPSVNNVVILKEETDTMDLNSVCSPLVNNVVILEDDIKIEPEAGCSKENTEEALENGQFEQFICKNEEVHLKMECDDDSLDLAEG